MRQQRRETCRVFNSMSGHDFLIGCRTGNAIQFGLNKKFCLTCTSANRRNVDVKDNPCSINWDGASGAMESSSSLDLIVKIHTK